MTRARREWRGVAWDLHDHACGLTMDYMLLLFPLRGPKAREVFNEVLLAYRRSLSKRDCIFLALQIAIERSGVSANGRRKDDRR